MTTTTPVTCPSGVQPVAYTNTQSPTVITYCQSPASTTITVTAGSPTIATYTLDSSWPPGSYIAGYFDRTYQGGGTSGTTTYGYTLAGTATEGRGSYQILVTPPASGLPVGGVAIDVVLVVLNGNNVNAITLYDPQDLEGPYSPPPLQ